MIPRCVGGLLIIYYGTTLQNRDRGEEACASIKKPLSHGHGSEIQSQAVLAHDTQLLLKFDIILSPSLRAGLSPRLTVKTDDIRLRFGIFFH